LSGRAQQILSRFPAHFEAPRPGKRLGDVTQAVALDLDTLSAALARVRRARRLLDADELGDLLRIGAVHGIAAAELDVLFTRFAVGRALADTAATSDDDAEALIGMWGIGEGAPRLPKYAPRASVSTFARRALGYPVLLDAVRRRIGAICENHARGNGTIRAAIEGAANALDLDVKSVVHSSDRYLHSAVVEDRLRLAFPAVVNGKPAEQEFALAEEHLLVEENPLVPARTGDAGRKHGELFSVPRRGFERATLQVMVTGVVNRTVGPMLVNRDEGHGVGFTGAVPPGTTVSFTEEGRVLLDSTDVTSMAYAWKGACFADATAVRPTDFFFDSPSVNPDQLARFVVSTPPGAMASSFAFPHAGDGLPMPGIAVGETRFAFFVQEAHWSRLDSSSEVPRIERVEPRPAVGFSDESVFAPGPSETRQTAGVVSLAWHERSAFSVTVWIPKRFLALTPDDDEGRQTLQRVAFAMNRFRPAGVQVDVKFLDERWVLGRGVALSEDGSSDAIAGPGSGTELWAVPEEPEE